jgi:hypothetical protein
MTSEHRTLIDLTDITGVEFECTHCGAKVLYPFDRHDRLIDQCPNCHEHWLVDSPMRHPSAATTADGVKKVIASLHLLSKDPMVRARVRLLVEDKPQPANLSNPAKS